MQSLRITDLNDVVYTFDSLVYPGTALSCHSFVHVLFIPALIFLVSFLCFLSFLSILSHLTFDPPVGLL